jgi:hypothetical protein
LQRIESDAILLLSLARVYGALKRKAGVSWDGKQISTNWSAFEITRKRRKGYPSEARVKRGMRVVHGDKELTEKLGRNDPCPCGSGRRFQELLYVDGPV